MRTSSSGLSGSTTLLDCKCKTGYFTPYGQTGNECFQCPVGAVCEGGRTTPYAKEGFWYLQQRAYRRVFVQCKPADLCLIGGFCKRGHRGPYCSDCRPKHFRRGLRCYPCDFGGQLSGNALLLMIIGFMVAMCIAMYFLAAPEALHHSAALYICFYLTQALDDFNDMTMAWPTEWEIVFSTMSIFNFDLQQALHH